MSEFSNLQEESIDEERDEKIEYRFSVISCLLGCFVMLVVLIILYVILSKAWDDLYELLAVQHPSQVTVVTRDEDLPPLGEHIYDPFTSYQGSDSNLFCSVRNKLELYATVQLCNGILSVSGYEYIDGGELLDGRINENFFYDLVSDQFINQSQTIFISEYDGRHFTIKDKRDHVSLPFSGVMLLSD